MPLCSQTKEEPIWWKMERNGEYLQVASHLLFKVLSDSTRNVHADYLHIARAYGYIGDYEKAAFYWRKSVENIQLEDEPQFEWYYKGTLAFFERDKKTLFKYMSLLKKKHSDYYKNNLKTLESLYGNFEKSYKEAIQQDN